MTTRNKRLRKLEQTLRTRPIKPEVVKAAYDRFRKTGELPDEQHIAAQVVELLQSGLEAEEWLAYQGDEKSLIRALVCTPPRPKDEVMDRLLNEAVWGDEMVRWASRHVLKALAEVLKLLDEDGKDVSQPIFAGCEMQLPDFDSLGFQMLGFPEKLAIPPHEKQALRLFDRYAVLRERIDHADKRWFDEWAAAVGMFRSHGELPEDELLRDAVLADSELLCLVQLICGQGDVELMAAFDAAARATGEEREVAISCVRKMVEDGRLLRGPGMECALRAVFGGRRGSLDGQVPQSPCHISLGMRHRACAAMRSWGRG